MHRSSAYIFFPSHTSKGCFGELKLPIVPTQVFAVPIFPDFVF